MEDTGLILPLGEWVLKAACTQVQSWHEGMSPELKLAVNLSGVQFNREDICKTVRRVLDATGLAPRFLELEITESIAMEDPDDTTKKLEELKAMGVHLAIDDFGTGYSSLSYLKNFPLDRIKVAQDFVRDIPADKGDSAIVETILVMARILDLDVIAEGVETLEQLRFLWSRGCRHMQGYYFSMPLTADSVDHYLAQGLFNEGVCPVQLEWRSDATTPSAVPGTADR